MSLGSLTLWLLNLVVIGALSKSNALFYFDVNPTVPTHFCVDMVTLIVIMFSFLRKTLIVSMI